MSRIKVIAFDADDTLWVNEPYYQEAEKLLCSMLSEFASAELVSAELLKTEVQNIGLYGFGAKAFVLSMIETAIGVSNGQVKASTIDSIIAIGKELIEKPIELLGDIAAVLTELKQRYILVLATKGDLLDQQRKLKKSGLEGLFNHVEIMSDKMEEDYRFLFKKLDIGPAEFLMVGNSLKSDILPVVAIGGTAIHIPYHITWQHETHAEPIRHAKIFQIKSIGDIYSVLGN